MFAYVTVTLLNTVRPEDYGLPSDCSAEEFENAIQTDILLREKDISDAANMCMNDIEIDIMDGEC